MDKELLKEILSIPSYNTRESAMVDFLTSWGIKNKIPVMLDAFGNVYLKKGEVKEGEYFPCVVSHIDTVHADHTALIIHNQKLIIEEEENDVYDSNITELHAIHPITNAMTGCGGDDKAGVFICLELIKKFDNIIGVFLKEEEFGCIGARHASIDILNKVGYIIEFDAPTNNWLSYVCSNVQLFNREFFLEIEPILEKYDINNIHDHDPYTDIMVLKRMFPVNCLNFFAGYYNAHSKWEYVVPNDCEKAINMGFEIIEHLGNKIYPFKFRKIPEEIENVIFNKQVIV